MPRLISIHDKTQIEAFARRNPFVHLFKISDLDDFFWDYTVWYGWENNGNISQLCLMYTAPAIPSILIYPEPPHDDMRDLLNALVNILPPQFYGHLPPDMLDILAPHYHVTPRGEYIKMGLTDTFRLKDFDTSNVEQFTPADCNRLKALYDLAYPANIFDMRMLETGQYYGIRDGDEIISVAGIHAYSAAYKVAVLGNITTHPAHRGQGLGTATCAKLCQALHANGITHIGLNVLSDNMTAIRIYEGLGFETVLEFSAYTFSAI